MGDKRVWNGASVEVVPYGDDDNSIFVENYVKPIHYVVGFTRDDQMTVQISGRKAVEDRCRAEGKVWDGRNGGGGI